jgi:hypothetical protein
MPDPIRCPLANALEIEHDGKQFGTYVATIPSAHTLDDVMAPEYFGRMQSRSQVDRLLRPGDFIDVRSEDFSWFVRVMVRACLPTVDKVITAAIVPATVFDVGVLPDGWSMEYKGNERKWTIFYMGVEKAALFRTQEEARAKIDELAGAQPATPRNQGGRPPKAKAEVEPAKEPEPV